MPAARPAMTALFWAALLVGGPSGSAAEEVPASPEAGSWGREHLRGINAYGAFVRADFADLAAWNVNLVRYQIIRPELVQGAGGWEVGVRTLQAIDAVLAQARAVGIRVVLDLHAHEVLFPGAAWEATTLAVWQDAGNRQRIAALWRHLAARYREDRLVAGYEILNEPHPPLTQAGLQAMNTMFREVTAAIRSIDAWHTIVIGGARFSRPSAIAGLEPTGDPNTVYTFHMYEPTEFTHQGVGFMNAPFGQIYPGIIPLGWNEPRVPTLVDRAFLVAAMKPVVEFQRRHGVRIWVGEFAARRTCPGGSALSWLRDAIEEFEANGWDWSYHCFRGDRHRNGAGFCLEHADDEHEAAVTPATRRVTDRLLLLQSYLARNRVPVPGP